MAHPLDGARLKIVRAHKHLKSLDDEIERYLKTKPYDIVVKREGNLTIAEGVVTVEPPDSTSCIVGDCITNLRAALDYIAWEIVSKVGLLATMSDGQKRQIAFPIVDSHADFTKPNVSPSLQLLRSNQAIPLSVIESVQPFHAGYDPLKSLRDLVNIDKHRMLLLCIGIFECSPTIKVFKDGILTHTGYGRSLTVQHNAPGQPGGTEGRVHVEVEGEGTISIALKDVPMPTLPVCEFLNNIVKCVADIIPRFDPFV
jgi:hypothetical protein